VKIQNQVADSDVEGLFIPGLQPFLKWPGGKSSELPKISASQPRDLPKRFLDPFVGGGSVLFATHPDIPAAVNDICPELIDIYQAGKRNDQVLKSNLLKIADGWSAIEKLEEKLETSAIALIAGKVDVEKATRELITASSNLVLEFNPDLSAEFVRRLESDLPKKIARILKLQIVKERELPLEEYISNLEGSVRAAYYMSIRDRYNQKRVKDHFDKVRVSDFFFLREYCYASMFRFNSKGEFNIPYGGVTYNKKLFRTKVERVFSEEYSSRLGNTIFYNLDFAEYIEQVSPEKNDFLFIDPPYDSDFTDYDGKSFVETDQYRLSDYLNQCNAQVMIVIGDTPLIRKLYPTTRWKILEDDFNYKWTIKSRNERSKTHLTITNY